MNDPMIIAAAIVLVIAAVGSTFVQIINAKAAADERKEAKAGRLKMDANALINDGKNNEIIKQGTAIHTLTNSNLTQLTSDLKIALSEIDGLKKIINIKDKIIDNPVIAPVVVTRIAETVSSEVKAGQEPILNEIKKNTKDTVNAVKDLKESK